MRRAATFLVPIGCVLCACTARETGGRVADAAPHATSSLAERTDLPLLEGEYARVRGQLAGAGAAVLLIDTAAQFSLLDERFARAHSLPLEPFHVQVGASATPTGSIDHVARVERLELGAAVVRDVRLGVFDFSACAWLADCDGILGQDLLRTWFVALDGPGRRLVLLPHTTLEAAFAQLFDGRVGAVRFEPDWSLGIPVLPCKLAGAGDVAFVVDTGANFLCLPPATIAALALKPLRSEVVTTLDGSAERQVYDLPKTSLGALSIWGEVQSWERGVLGWTVLQQFVYVQPGEKEPVYLLSNPRWK